MMNLKAVTGAACTAVGLVGICGLAWVQLDENLSVILCSALFMVIYAGLGLIYASRQVLVPEAAAVVDAPLSETDSGKNVSVLMPEAGAVVDAAVSPQFELSRIP